MTEQDALESAIGDYIGLGEMDGCNVEGLAEHILKHLREHSPYHLLPLGGMHLSDPNSFKGAKRW